MTKRYLKQLVKNDINVMVYDIETEVNAADIFRPGQQYVGHKALQAGRDKCEIITIQYMWIHEKKVHNLSWIGTDVSSKRIVEEFDKEAQKATIIIGKNSDRFDMKHMNTQRLLHGLKPFPDWHLPKRSEDLERQMRKHFMLPSYSLDYLSKMLFNSGKDSMEFADWQKIRAFKEILAVEREGVKGDHLNAVANVLYKNTADNLKKLGQKALDKMIKYGNKDITDTKKCWLKLLPYIKPRINLAHIEGSKDGNYLRCTICAGTNIVKNGISRTYSIAKQKFLCKDCGVHAGKATILKSGKLGKME